MAGPSLPKPNLATGENCILVRNTAVGRIETARVCTLEENGKNPDEWAAVLFTGRGIDRIDGGPTAAGFDQWRPTTWVWDANVARHKPPGTEWDEKRNAFVPAAERLPLRTDLPSPAEGEDREAWFARVVKSFPAMSSDAGKDMAGGIWLEAQVKVSAPASGGLAPSPSFPMP